jgi:hypothetical protein
MVMEASAETPKYSLKKNFFSVRLNTTAINVILFLLPEGTKEQRSERLTDVHIYIS